MDNEQRQHLESLRRLHQRRLQALELRTALHGGATPPEVSIEIEDIQTIIASLDTQLKQDLRTASPGEHSTPQPLRHNLPAYTTAFIGRKREIADLCTLLRRSDVRLVTLTGAGGIGKTRLALQVVAELLDEFEHGVFFVALEPISDPHLVEITIAQTLGIKETAGQLLLENLKRYLGDKQLLLLLDNFEHLATAVPLVARLLAVAPQLKVLITSRALLHLSGEHEYSVPPLALPDRTQRPSIQTLSQCEAVALFVARIQAIKRDFKITEANGSTVAEICARLDGLPLAIELAAARSKLFPAEALLARLNNRLKFLVGGARDLPARQQILRNTIAWSYELLGAGEQTLFARLGVFVGGCTVEAAEAVCSVDGDLGVHVLDWLVSLVNQSLFRQDVGADGEPRLTMLETIREYALERLELHGEAESIRRQHADYYVALAEAAEQQLRGAQQRYWLAHLDTEHDNLRAALQWSLAAMDAPEQALRLAGALGTFWLTRGYYAEGQAQLQRALMGAPAAPIGVRARAFAWAARMAVGYDRDQARRLAEESLALFRDLGDQRGIAFGLETEARVTFYREDMVAAHECFAIALARWREVGDKGHIADVLNIFGIYLNRCQEVEQAGTLFHESLALCRELHYPGGLAWALYGLGEVLYRQEAYGPARAHYLESLALLRELDDQEGLAWIVDALGKLARAEGQHAEAARWYTESLAISQRHGIRQGIAEDLESLGYAALGQGNDTQAMAYFQESLALAVELELKRGLANCIAGLAGVAAGQGQPERAARLLGATEALYSREKMQKNIIDRPEQDRIIIKARAQMDEAAFAAAWAAGHAMTLEQAIAEAIELGDVD
jgi:predicted ATPase